MKRSSAKKASKHSTIRKNGESSVYDLSPARLFSRPIFGVYGLLSLAYVTPLGDVSCLRLILGSHAITEPLTGTSNMPDSGGGRIGTFQVVQRPKSSVIAPVFSIGLNGYRGAKPA